VTAHAVLELIAAQVRGCTACGLSGGRTNAVPGEGPADAAVMLIGEGPGMHEDRQGRPFVGQSGQLLTTLLGLAGLRRSDVFIANVVKCRPPQNRDPQPDEINCCTERFLFRQIAAINPQVIVTLGRFSLGLFLPNTRIMRVHGQPHLVDGRLIVPMLHPAAALHQPQNRPLIEADFRRLPELLAAHQAQQQPTSATPDPPPVPAVGQLSLFD
jgi:uracil-DNA glycosylase